MKGILKRYEEQINDELNSLISRKWHEDFVDTSDVEELYTKYIDIQDEIEQYIEENDLDDVQDEYKIKEQFEKYDNYFEFGQACLIDFVDFAIRILDENGTINYLKRQQN